jgi:hypothetical protein
MITFEQVRQAPAGPTHMALLKAYLSQPVSHWQAGMGESRGRMLPAREAAPRGSRRHGGSRRLTVRYREELLAPVRERQAAAEHWQAEAARVEQVKQAAGAMGAFLRGAEQVRQEAGRVEPRTWQEALERRYWHLRQQRLTWQALAAAAPYGRAVLDPAYASGTAVNGAELLAGERWQATPWQVRQARTITVPPWSQGWLVKQALRRSWRQALPNGWLGAEAAAAVERGAKWQPLVLVVEQQADGSSRRQVKQQVRPETMAERGARMRQLLVAAGFSGTAAANAE